MKEQQQYYYYCYSGMVSLESGGGLQVGCSFRALRKVRVFYCGVQGCRLVPHPMGWEQTGGKGYNNRELYATD